MIPEACQNEFSEAGNTFGRGEIKLAGFLKNVSAFFCAYAEAFLLRIFLRRFFLAMASPEDNGSLSNRLRMFSSSDNKSV